MASVEERLARLERRMAEQIRVGELVELTDGGQRGTYAVRSLAEGYPDLDAEPAELVPNCILTEPRYGATNLVQSTPTVRSTRHPGELALLVQPGLAQDITIAVRAIRAVPHGTVPELAAAVHEYVEGAPDLATHSVVLRGEDDGEVFVWRMTPFGPYVALPNSHPARYSDLEAFPLPIINPYAVVSAKEDQSVSWTIPGIGAIPFTGRVTAEYHYDAARTSRETAGAGINTDHDHRLPLMMRSRAFGIQNVASTPAGGWTPPLPAADTVDDSLGTDTQGTEFRGTINAATFRLTWDVVSPDAQCDLTVLSNASGLRDYPRRVDVSKATGGTGDDAPDNFSLAGPVDNQDRKSYTADAIPLDVGGNTVLLQTTGPFGEGRLYTFNVHRE